MPLVALVCPHCEKPVQVQVTEVARSRTCPSCNQALMLQVAERSSGQKRKALLMADVPPVEVAVQESSVLAQEQFLGAAYDRMKADPELARASRQLFAGVATVALLIVAVIAWDMMPARAPDAAPLAAAAPLKSGPQLVKKDLVSQQRQSLPSPMMSDRMTHMADVSEGTPGE